MELDPDELDDCVRRAFREDLGSRGDITAALVVPESARTRGRVRAKQAGVLAGMTVARACVAHVASLPGGLGLGEQSSGRDGATLVPGDVVMQVEGPARAVLVVERTLLNFVQRLSGIATLTRRLVDAVSGTRARIFDTRKTTPGLRQLEKAAVVAGGGYNHRTGLYDQVLLKENHFALARPLDYESVVRRCVAGSERPVVAEARTVEEGTAAVRGGAGVVMLDNFQPGEGLVKAVAALRAEAARSGRTVEVEVSGGVRLENVRAYAECGVDRISVGALTHSAPSLDLSMKVEGVA